MKDSRLLKFDGFEFDTENYRLSHHQSDVKLRPKARQLLRLLILNRERVVPKQEILNHLWGSAYARDHLLFQLISELRKSPFDPTYIRTQPNIGYQWNVKTKEIKFTSVNWFSGPALPAFYVLLSAVALSVFLSLKPPISTTTLPAHSAFSKGILAMELGENAQAVGWFEFALNENPESNETLLFLAEALHRDTDNQAALNHVQTLLEQPDLSRYDYIATNDLLSRIRQDQGRLREALEYSKLSNDMLGIAMCSADAVEQRTQFLNQQIAAIPETYSEVKSDKLPENIENNQRIESSQKYRDRCIELERSLEETSQCTPANNTYRVLEKIS